MFVFFMFSGDCSYSRAKKENFYRFLFKQCARKKKKEEKRSKQRKSGPENIWFNTLIELHPLVMAGVFQRFMQPGGPMEITKNNLYDQ